MENLKKNCNVNNLSFVLNDFNLSSTGNKGYGYTYGRYRYSNYYYGGYGSYGSYGYSYGETYDDSPKKSSLLQKLEKIRFYRRIRRIINK
jgi:hypothetical protein